MIEFDQVLRRFGRTLAVNRLTLTIPQGELFALLGPNGAGKTTTIRMLVGLLQPDSGQVRVCGVDCSRNPREASSRLGYVPDEQFLYEKLSGRELLQFAAEMHGLDRATTRDRISRETERFELGNFLDNLTETYSHGMRQRLTFATALLHDPQVLVVDEPMVGLDPRSARVVKDLLRAEAAAGKTVLMSTHTLGVAEEIADRIGILNHGQLGFLGTLAELGQELSAPHQALEHLFLELTNGHAASNQQGARK
jgi:ABC-2 type transport system ATP-binding protein